MNLAKNVRNKRANVLRIRIPRAAVWLIGIVAASVCGLWPLSSKAHGGLSMDSDMCKLSIGAYNMHFAGYQPQANGNKEFCEDIPATGNTIVVMDTIDPELREMPIEVRLIEDTGDESRLDAVTVLHLPPKVYPTGSIPLQYNFLRPGKYVGLVTAGNTGQYVSRFPFSVGMDRVNYSSYLLYLGVALVGAGFYRYAGRARKVPQEKRG